MTLKYSLYPGYVHSESDGQRHFVSARQLARLYNVKWEECFVVDPPGELPAHLAQAQRSIGAGLIQLHPRYDGKYQCPER